MASNKPLAFLLLLFAILTFLVGFRWGKEVEHSDKSYIPPTGIPSPTIATPSPTAVPLTFSTYKHEGCGLTVILPKQFTADKQSSDSGSFTSSGQKVGVVCEKNATQAFLKAHTDLSLAKTYMRNGQKVLAFEGTNGTDQWIIKNSAGKSVLVTTPTTMTEVVIKTADVNSK